LEKLKTSLANSQTVFSRQLEALIALRSLFRSVYPKKTDPEMDWHDACEAIAGSFGEHADALDGFLRLHAAVLPNDVLSKIESAAVMASDGVFESSWDRSGNSVEPTDDATKTADKLVDILKEAVSELQKAIDAQIPGRTPSA
jgi:hypothetical protein